MADASATAAPAGRKITFDALPKAPKMPSAENIAEAREEPAAETEIVASDATPEAPSPVSDVPADVAAEKADKAGSDSSDDNASVETLVAPSTPAVPDTAAPSEPEPAVAPADPSSPLLVEQARRLSIYEASSPPLGSLPKALPKLPNPLPPVPQPLPSAAKVPNFMSINLPPPLLDPSKIPDSIKTAERPRPIRSQTIDIIRDSSGTDFGLSSSLPASTRIDRSMASGDALAPSPSLSTSPPPMSASPPASMSSSSLPSSFLVHAASAGMIAMTAGSSATIERRRGTLMRSRASADHLVARETPSFMSGRERIAQRMTRRSKHPQLQRRHAFTDCSFAPSADAFCYVCEGLIKTLRFVACQRCARIAHVDCKAAGMHQNPVCEELQENSCYEIVDKLDDAFKDKVQRVIVLKAELKDLAKQRAASPFDEVLVKKEELAMMELVMLTSTLYVLADDMPEDTRKLYLPEEEDENKRRSKIFFGRG